MKPVLVFDVVLQPTATWMQDSQPTVGNQFQSEVVHGGYFSATAMKQTHSASSRMRPEFRYRPR